MRLFSFRHGKFRRLGLDGIIGGTPRHLDLTRGWRAYITATRLSLPSFPDFDDLLRVELFRPDLLEACIAFLDTLPGRELDDLTLSGPIAFDVPVKHPPKILCLAKNYAEHAKEMGGAAPPEPMFFSKLSTSLLAPDQPIRLPANFPGRVDHEVELAVIIGKRGRDISAADAGQFIAGYTIFNDVTHRDLQALDKQAGMPWTRSKSFDTFAPCGPYFVLPDTFDPAAATGVAISCRVNDEPRQTGSTADMVHPVPAIIAALSRYCTLEPGDIIATGTPHGVGPIRSGDIVTCEITGIGTLRNPVQ